MSGGHFDYAQYRIDDIVDSIERYIDGVELDDCDIRDYLDDRWLDEKEIAYVKEHKHTLPNSYGYDDEIIGEFKKGVYYLRLAQIYAQRIDWLLSGDDGDESFKNRLKEEIDELNSKYKIHARGSNT